jgi:chemotaxis protein methyltransferase CheR
MRTLGIASHQDYLKLVCAGGGEEELVRLLDAISTNFTSFFREPVHFEILADLTREWVAAGQSRLRIWSAASSSGEEPYTLAMVLREVLGDPRYDVSILATDISTAVLTQARQGVYTGKQVATVPAQMKREYLEPLEFEREVRYRVRPHLKTMVRFARLNLSVQPYPMAGPFDVVFCRNVMIYFDRDLRRRLVGEIGRLLRPGGYLMVGHTESLAGAGTSLRGVSPSVYVKDGEA